MSHFTVLVVTKGNKEALDKALAAALQPFHEFECTGTDDEFVKTVSRDIADDRVKYDERFKEQASKGGGAARRLAGLAR